MNEPTPRSGQLSPDGSWYWSGLTWVAAVSPDRQWRWDGRWWVPLPPVSSKKPWTVADRLALIGWAAVVIAASAVCNQLFFRGGGVRASAAFVAFVVVAPLAFGVAGGVLIRRGASMKQAFGLAAFGALWPALSLFVVWTADPSACTAPAGADCDTGLGLGAVFVFTACYVPSLVGVAFGKHMGGGTRRSLGQASQ